MKKTINKPGLIRLFHFQNFIYLLKGHWKQFPISHLETFKRRNFSVQSQMPLWLGLGEKTTFTHKENLIVHFNLIDDRPTPTQQMRGISGESFFSSLAGVTSFSGWKHNEVWWWCDVFSERISRSWFLCAFSMASQYYMAKSRWDVQRRKV